MKTWFRQHRVALASAFGRLWSSPLTTLLSFIVIGIALALPSTGFVLLENLHELSNRATNIQQISLYLQKNVSPEQVEAIKKSLSDSQIHWQYVSRDEALKRLQNDGLADVMNNLPENPLPDAFIVDLGDLPADAVEKFAASFKSWPSVDSVQLDSLWVKRFAAILRIGKMLVLLLSVVLAVGSIAVTFNTIRLQVMYHSDEIEVAELIGATDAFIQRPFHYYGALQGFFGAFFAVGAVFLAIHFLNLPVVELAKLYDSQFVLKYPTPEQIAGLSAIGLILGWFGAYLSVNLSLLQLRRLR